MAGINIENRASGISRLTRLLRSSKNGEPQVHETSEAETPELALPVISWAEQNARAEQQDRLRHVFFKTVNKKFALSDVKCGTQHVPHEGVLPIEFWADTLERAKAVKSLVQAQYAEAVAAGLVDVKIMFDKHEPKAEHRLVVVFVKDYEKSDLVSAKV